MFIKLLAYIIAIFISPIIGILATIVLFPIALTSSKLKDRVRLESFHLIEQGVFIVFGFLTTFISVWFSSKMFVLFDLKPTLLMVILIGISFVWHQWREIYKYEGQRAEIEMADLWGGVIGIILGGVYFL